MKRVKKYFKHIGKYYGAFLGMLLLFATNLNAQDCQQLIINMYDSYGDGWNGNTLSIGDNSITLESGAEGVDSICVNLEECNTIEVGGGSYGGEVSWTIILYRTYLSSPV